jgi:hypothetical protein
VELGRSQRDPSASEERLGLAAPSTILRMVPLPRHAGEDHGTAGDYGSRCVWVGSSSALPKVPVRLVSIHS